MTHIRVWERNNCVFLDLVSMNTQFEVKRFLRRGHPYFSQEVSFHLKRLKIVTGYSVTNETDLCLEVAP